MNTSSQKERKFIDLHTTGIGYVGRIREVSTKKGSFLACTVAALVGEIGEGIKAEYRYFDVRVSGEQAQQLIRSCEEAVNAQRKVLIGFRIGDIWLDTFIYSKGKNEGKPGASLKGRLLHINLIQVDGKQIYKTERSPSSVEEQVVAVMDAPSSIQMVEHPVVPTAVSTEQSSQAA